MDYVNNNSISKLEKNNTVAVGIFYWSPLLWHLKLHYFFPYCFMYNHDDWQNILVNLTLMNLMEHTE